MSVLSLKYKTKAGTLTAPGDVDPGAFIPIASASGTGSSNTITFANIPQVYEHLHIRAFVRSAQSAAYDVLYGHNFDGAAQSSNGAYHAIYGTNSAPGISSGTGSYSLPLGYVPADNAGGSVYAIVTMDILDYANTNKNTTIRFMSGFDDNGWTSGNINVAFGSGLPVALGTNAVTNITLLCNGNLTTASKISLYGIKRAGA